MVIRWKHAKPATSEIAETVAMFFKASLRIGAGLRTGDKPSLPSPSSTEERNADANGRRAATTGATTGGRKAKRPTATKRTDEAAPIARNGETS